MNTEKIELTPGSVIIKCPHCLVCSMALSKEEYAAVTSGQQMIEVCPVCSREVTICEL